MCDLETRRCGRFAGNRWVTESLSWGDLFPERGERVRQKAASRPSARLGGEPFKSGEAPPFVRLNQDPTGRYHEVSKTLNDEEFIAYRWQDNEAVAVAHADDAWLYGEGREGRVSRRGGVFDGY